jgi:hypothetical protein
VFGSKTLSDEQACRSVRPVGGVVDNGQLRHLSETFAGPVRTAAVKRAACVCVSMSFLGLSLQDMDCRSDTPVFATDEFDERLGIWMRRLAKYSFCASRFNDASPVHHRDPIGNMHGCREVVRDHEDPDALIGEFPKSLQDANPDRQIQHRDWLVRHDHVRPHNQACCQGNALPLSTGELVYVAFQVQFRWCEAYCRKRCLDPTVPLVPWELSLMDQQRLTYDVPDLITGVQRRIRILEYRPNPLAQRTQLSSAFGVHLLAVEPYTTLIRLEQAEANKRCCCLAAAGLSNEGEQLASMDGKGDVVHSDRGWWGCAEKVCQATTSFEPYADVLQLQNCLRPAAVGFGHDRGRLRLVT